MTWCGALLNLAVGLVTLSASCSAARPKPVEGFAANGYFLALSQAFASTATSDFGLLLADEAAAYTQTPDVSGNSGGVSYTFSSFRYHLNLQEPDVVATATGVKLTFKKFKFLIGFNYHVHKVVSENGNVAVFTTDVQGSQLVVDIDINLEGPAPQVSVLTVSLNYDAGDCEVFAQCTSTFCLIPVSDIAQAIAQNFNKEFDAAVRSAANTAAKTYIKGLSTTVALPDVALDVMLKGDFNPAGSSVVLSGTGAVVPRSQPSFTGPWKPQVVPSETFLEKPPSGAALALTNYVPRTALTALWKAGYFSNSVTAKDVPADSPIKLNTADAFWLMAVPGLAHFPGMNISVQTSVPSGIKAESLFDAVIGPKGVVLNITLNANFTLVNKTKSVAGFSLQLKFGALAFFSAHDNKTARLIELKPAFSDWDIRSKVLHSAVGKIDVADIDTLMKLIAVIAAPKAPISVPWPENFDLNEAGVAYDKGFLALSASPAYTKKIPYSACGQTRCAATLSCCKYGNANECCVFQGATCCSTFCCPGGWECCGTNECCEPRTGKSWNATALASLSR